MIRIQLFDNLQTLVEFFSQISLNIFTSKISSKSVLFRFTSKNRFFGTLHFHFSSLGWPHKNFRKCSKCLKNMFKLIFRKFYEVIFEVNIPNKTIFGDLVISKWFRSEFEVKWIFPKKRFLVISKWSEVPKERD